MDTLFTEMENERKSEVAPLAVRMRPRTLEEVVGQDEAVGPGSWLRNAIEQDQLSSVILFGPDSIYDTVAPMRPSPTCPPSRTAPITRCPARRGTG